MDFHLLSFDFSFSFLRVFVNFLFLAILDLKLMCEFGNSICVFYALMHSRCIETSPVLAGL